VPDLFEAWFGSSSVSRCIPCEVCNLEKRVDALPAVRFPCFRSNYPVAGGSRNLAR
jgi:hypothetical protein